MSDLVAIVEGHLDAFAGWAEVIDQIGDDDWDRPTGCPGWSVRDNLAHVIGLERMMLGEPFPDHVIEPRPAHVRDDVGAFMEVDVDLRRSRPIAEVVAEFDDAAARRVAVLRAMTEDDLLLESASPLGGTAPVGRFLPLRVFDLWAHEQDARRAAGLPDRHTGPAADVSVDRIRRGLSSLVRRAGEGAGGVVVVEVAGPQTFTLAVDLVTGYLDHVPAERVVTLGVDFADLVPLACGRADARSPGEAFRIEGDVLLGHRLVADLAMTP